MVVANWKDNSVNRGGIVSVSRVAGWQDNSKMDGRKSVNQASVTE